MDAPAPPPVVVEDAADVQAAQVLVVEDVALDVALDVPLVVALEG